MEPREKLRKFLDNDKKVLRFEGEWDDTASLYGDKNSYVITYFLSDDTVEINEVCWRLGRVGLIRVAL